MKTRIVTFIMALLLPVPAFAQPPVGRGAPPAQNRAALERQVVQQFSLRMQRDLGLSETAHARLEQTLLEMTARERGRALEAETLQRRLMAAVRNPETPDTQFAQILSELHALRVRDHQEWLHEQQELARTMSPRQRAEFMLVVGRFQQRIRNMIDNRAGRGGG